MPPRTPRSLMGSPGGGGCTRHRVSTRSRDLVPRSRRLLDLAAPTRGVRSSRPAARLIAARLITVRLIVGPDVDAPAGEPGGEAGVLALLADRQGQLEVGHDDARR